MISYFLLPFDVFNVSITGLLCNLSLWKKFRENATLYEIYTTSGKDIAVFAEACGLPYKVSAPVKKEDKKPTTPKQVCYEKDKTESFILSLSTTDTDPNTGKNRSSPIFR